jgi:hypothetical protein
VGISSKDADQELADKAVFSLRAGYTNGGSEMMIWSRAPRMMEQSNAQHSKNSIDRNYERS